MKYLLFLFLLMPLSILSQETIQTNQGEVSIETKIECLNNECKTLESFKIKKKTPQTLNELEIGSCYIHRKSDFIFYFLKKDTYNAEYGVLTWENKELQRVGVNKGRIGIQDLSLVRLHKVPCSLFELYDEKTVNKCLKTSLSVCILR